MHDLHLLHFPDGTDFVKPMEGFHPDTIFRYFPFVSGKSQINENALRIETNPRMLMGYRPPKEWLCCPVTEYLDQTLATREPGGDKALNILQGERRNNRRP